MHALTRAALLLAAAALAASASRGGHARAAPDPPAAACAPLGAPVCASCESAADGDAHAMSAARPDGVDIARAGLLAAFAALPLAFEANRGQTDARVHYLARGIGYQVFALGDGAVLKLDGAAVRIAFVGAAPAPEVSGEGALAAPSHYFVGSDASRHLVDVARYARVRYRDLYPGIDLVYYGTQGQLEYDLILAPYAQPSRIELSFEGIEALEFGADGEVVLRTATGEIVQRRPHVYQEVAGVRRAIDGRYVALGGHRVGISLDPYDESLPVVIDPVLAYSTFVGGSGGDFATAIAIDGAGNAYVAGHTASANFPKVGAYDGLLGNGDTDAFVSKLNAAGTALVYATYLGGSRSVDRATGIAVDGAGNAYVTGVTSGSDFPTTTGAYQRGSSAGGSFVAKLGASGNTLAYSSYVLNAATKAIAVDADGSAYVTGSAASGFVTTENAFQWTSPSPSATSAFVLKLNAAGTAPVYATFLGGNGESVGNGIAVDVAKAAYVAGSTIASNVATANAAQAASGGGFDAFVAKLDAAGSARIYSTYVGGRNGDFANAIAVDSSGSAYVAGETYSPDFPTSPFAFYSTMPGASNQYSIQGVAFVAKLTPTGSGFAYSTYLGGNICGSTYCLTSQSPPTTPGDAAHGIAVDGQGHAYVTGIARSYTFPLVDSLLPAKQSASQDSVFVTKLSQAGNALLYSTLVRTGTATSGNTPGGTPFDAGKAIAVDASGAAYVALEGSTGFPTTSGAFQAANAGATDAVAFKLSSGNGQMTLAATPNPSVAGQPVQVTATLAGGGSAGSVTFRYYSNGFNGSVGAALVNGGAAVTLTLGAGVHTLSAVYRNGSANIADSPIVYQVAHPRASCN